jgi:hypothetical protein
MVITTSEISEVTEVTAPTFSNGNRLQICKKTTIPATMARKR